MISSTFLYQRKKSPFSAKLNLVALMDIFTILVFFLLLNSGESQNIENAKFVELPSSTTGIRPHQELTVSIGTEDIWFEGESVAKIADVLKQPDEPIETLVQALQDFTEKKGELTAFEKEKGLSVTIMGDKDVPYALLKSVMTTCRLQDYRNISLAVNHIGPMLAPQSTAKSSSTNSNVTGG
jgi:biopolymer transport protein ExbD